MSSDSAIRASWWPARAAAGGALTWLNAGVPSTQVAEWAGHSLAVLLQIYAKCLVGQEEAARRRIDGARRLRCLELQHVFGTATW